MTRVDAPSPRDVTDLMRRTEGPTRLLGIALDSVGPGHATASLTLDDRMLNGFGSAHGGILFLLADQALAYACNSENIATVAQGGSITFLSSSRNGERVVAEARRSGQAGRTGVYDVHVTAGDGRILAIFTGVSRSLGRPVIDKDSGSEEGKTEQR